jgi:nucleotide-binding universal stress UspA family protein
MPAQPVLVAVDLSTYDDAMIDRILTLPYARDTSLLLLHVLPMQTPTHARAEAAARVRAVLATRRARLADRFGAVATEVRIGDPYREIADRARSCNAAFIVIGGGRRVDHVGSTTQRVLRQGNPAVLAVNAAPFGPYRRPLIAVDREAAAYQVFAALHGICARDADVLDVMVPSAAFAGVETVWNHRRLVKAEPRWRLSRATDETSSLATAIAAREIDLVALGMHARTPGDRGVLGALAETVLTATTCDVLVLPIADARPVQSPMI